ncbi:hypothetical protein [Couchioplanes azureus]|uniref:hypothetical protein n=1 Tax=Couchioplanes caeruleus TaxID=56438 RepID=UPI0016708993|nr:hypothetical protein [Couchioplanes caeruleus]GGQ83241.1 hypothetical protein GCM10010166_61900 [Couchioplanes caeruleus subsp. azureus]
MTLWERALATYPQWREHLVALDDLTTRMRDLGPAVVDIAADMGPPIASRVADPDTAPGGVYGYGLWSARGEQARPALFVQPGLAPAGAAPASITSAGRMIERMQAAVPAETVAVALPPPQLQRASTRGSSVAPGMSVTIGSRRATLGLRVLAPDAAGPRRAILTAGHAAPVPGVIVRDEAGDLVGTVLSATSLGNAGQGVSIADVAVVAIDDRRTEADDEVGDHVDAAQPHDVVRIARSDSTAPILGLCPAFALKQGLGSWGHVAITAAAISRDGDSGAPVHRADGAVIGQIVAGYGSAYSLVQDAEYVMREAGVFLR